MFEKKKRGRPKGSKNNCRLGELKGTYYETTSEMRYSSISGNHAFNIFTEPTPLTELNKNDPIMTADGKMGFYVGNFQEGKFVNVTFDGYKVYSYDSRSIKRRKPKREPVKKEIEDENL